MKKFNNSFIKFITISIWVLFLLTLVLYLPSYSLEKVEIVVKPGMRARDVANILQDKKLIPNAYIFRVFLKIMGKDRNIEAGKYIFSEDMSLKKVIDVLVNGKPTLESILIPEGFTSREVAEILKNKAVIKDKKEFLKIAKEKQVEGYLFPDTYYMPEGYGVEKAIEMMEKRFREKMPKDFKERCRKLGLTESEVIILASLVEKEAKIDEDRPKIASVFLNRLKKGMKLESCATIQYILGTPKPNLTYKDLKIKSPYNTYLNKGLPPSPICNPGISSINAVLNPKKTDYFYFVLGKNGKHIFAKTYKEHLKNKKDAQK